MNSWKTEYDDQVVAIVNSNRRVTIDELCDRLDLMRDQIDEIVSRLVACGTIDNKLDASTKNPAYRPGKATRNSFSKQQEIHSMSSTNLASDCFNFSSLDPVSIERAFLAHVNRFEAQNRQVSWQDAPATFAAVSGDIADEDMFCAAMESLLDSGEIRVERLADGGNRLVTVS